MLKTSIAGDLLIYRFGRSELGAIRLDSAALKAKGYSDAGVILR